MKTAKIMAYIPTEATHFPRISRPIKSAFITAGRKSRPKKTGGFPKKPIAVPMIILSGPMIGPKIIPYSGATISAAANDDPLTPSIGNVGNMRRIAYRAAKVDANAIVRVLMRRFLDSKQTPIVNYYDGM